MNRNSSMKGTKVKFYDNAVLDVWFSDGLVKRFDMKSLYANHPQYQELSDTELFKSGKLYGRAVIIWNDNLELFLDEVYEKGKLVRKTKPIPNPDIGEAVSCARFDADVTQVRLSELTGIDQSDISKIERGVANPSIGTLKKIASALDMELKVSFEEKS